MWRIIEEAPRYVVNELGEIRAICRWTTPAKMIDKDGYPTVYLLVDKGHLIHRRVHRIVAEVFLDNPCNYAVVNHINHDRGDSRVENLEWCTEKYNIQEAKGCKIIVAKDGNIVGEYPSIRSAAADLGLSDTMIGYCLHGRYKSAKGYTFEYAK